MKALGIILIMSVIMSAGRTRAEDAEPVADATTPEISVDKISFFGWKEAWRLRNKSCEMVVVPQISRVMYFSLKGGENLIWVAPNANGQTYAAGGKDWRNLGGDKIWPEPQDKWGWPPPYHFDNAPSDAEALKGGVRLKTKTASPKLGCTLVREFTLDPEKPRVSIRQWFEKSQGDPIAMTLWTITQVRKPDFALLPLGGENEKKQKYRPLQGPVGDAPFFQTHETVCSLRYNDAKGQKVGITANAALDNDWVAAVYPKCIFVEARKLEKDAVYPDGNCHAELFVATPVNGPYVEMELLSPLKTIKSGEKLEDNCVWQIVPLTEEQAKDPEQAAAAARAAGATTLGDKKD